jgi:hypothetical protein
MRTTALALLVVLGAALVGCRSSGPDGQFARALPGDLPPSPRPGVRYCKVWVPATWRRVPHLVQATQGGMKNESITVMKTTAHEVMVQGPQKHTVDQCKPSCTTTLVETKPGGYHWEKDASGCWTYVYRHPEYRWCEKTVREQDVKFCYTTPPKFETVVETRPVKRCRQTYVPPKYDVVYKKEIYEPGHWEWRATSACGRAPQATRDGRAWSDKLPIKRRCPPCAKPAPALDCGCPRTN